MPRPRGTRRRGGSSTSGKLGRKAPNLWFSWGPVRSYTDPAKARGVWINTRYAGTCASCGTAIDIGEHVYWRPGVHTLTCLPCANRGAGDESESLNGLGDPEHGGASRDRVARFPESPRRREEAA